MGAIFYAWVHRLRLPSGRTRRHLLGVLLVLPLLTAAVPGRTAVEFGERVAWLNSARILAVPLPGWFRLAHVMLAFAVVFTAITFWQEVLPAFGRPAKGAEAAAAWLVARARALPGWSACRVLISPDDRLAISTSGVPGREGLTLSRGALAGLTTEQVDAVIRHEHAHWVGGRWWWSHALFGARLVQCFNPVALWAFREYCLEIEIDCDARAAGGRDAAVLARVLLRIYQDTDPRDVAARRALRRRVDVLLGSGVSDLALPIPTVVAATAVMVAVLPWLV
jgi:Zn-dependent protease with chaperone function